MSRRIREWKCLHIDKINSIVMSHRIRLLLSTQRARLVASDVHEPQYTWGVSVGGWDSETYATSSSTVNIKLLFVDEDVSRGFFAPCTHCGAQS
jgi:hypothetical protein